MKTKALISFAVTAPLVLHMQIVGFLMRWLSAYALLVEEGQMMVYVVCLQSCIKIYNMYVTNVYCLFGLV